MSKKNSYTPIIDDFNPTILKQSRGPFKGSVLYQRNKYRFGLISLVHSFSDSLWVKKIPRRENTNLIYNFNYQSNLYLAEIPVEKLKRIVLMKEPFFERFGVVIAHTQLCFIFNESVILYAQNEKSEHKKIELNSFIYSYNFIGGVKRVWTSNLKSSRLKNIVEKYSPLNGLWLLRRRYFGTHNVTNLNSWIKKEEKILARISESSKKGPRKSPTSLISLNLDNLDHSKILKDQLLYGHIHNRLEKRYETLFRNCGNIILRNIFPNILTKKNQSMKSIVWRIMGYFFPSYTDYSLHAHGVQTKEINLNNLKSMSIERYS